MKSPFSQKNERWPKLTGMDPKSGSAKGQYGDDRMLQSEYSDPNPQEFQVVKLTVTSMPRAT